MKIFANIPIALKLLRDVKYFDKEKQKIDAARAAGDFEEERRLILAATSLFGDMLRKQIGYELHVRGEENIPENGPVVIVLNHQGYADIPVCYAVFKKFQFGFVAKQYLSKTPFIGPWMPRTRNIFIENDDPKEALRAINRGIEYINDGFSLAICPEGTRSKGPKTGPFMKGALKLATKPGAVLLPVSLNGTYRMYEETGVIRGARVDVIVHEPIETAGMSRAQEKELAIRVEKQIRDGVESLVPLQPDYSGR